MSHITDPLNYATASYRLCTKLQPFGYVCTRDDDHGGPCALMAAPASDYELIDKLLAQRGRCSSAVVWEGGMRLTDFGKCYSNRARATTFEFNAVGRLISYSPWWKARWLLRDSGIYVRKA